MKKNTKISLVSLIAVLSLCGCGGTSSGTTSSAGGNTTSGTTSENGGSSVNSGATSGNGGSSSEVGINILPAVDIDISDENKAEDNVYDGVFGEYIELYEEAQELSDCSERYVAFAKAEAALLDSAAFVPTTTDGGSYAITHAAFRSLPYSQSGYDSSKLKTAVISKKLVTRAERDEMEVLWNEAKEKDTKYDPAAYLISKGHELDTTYKATFSSIPATLDIHDTSLASDTDYLVQGIDGLVEYDNLGNIKPAIAESWEVDNTKTVYTFHLRNDAKWYRSDGTVYGEVTAQDFVDGFRHMLDTKSGLGDLIKGVVKGAKRYGSGKELNFNNVGMKATDAHTLVITLEKEVPYFLSMLTYSPFAPLNGTFFLNQGGAFGVSEFKTAKGNTATYKYGIKGKPESILYNGAFHCTRMDDTSSIIYEANNGYYNSSAVKIKRIEYVYNDGSNITQLYRDVVDNKYVGIALNDDLLQLAKDDGRFKNNAYVSKTGSTTYFLGYNLYRTCFDAAGTDLDSKKSSDEKNKTQLAMLNKNFRKALSFAFDKRTWNAFSSGNDLADASLRNMYTSPTFVSLEKDVTVDGTTFKSGTTYGELVQHYIDTNYQGTIKCADAQDGTYNPSFAKAYMAQAVNDLTKDNPNFFSTPVKIEIINYSAQESSINQANAYKRQIEEILGSDKVRIEILNTQTLSDFYSASYYANFGNEVCYDLYWGSGWGPDFADPSSYLSTFLYDGEGYMTKVVGLY